MSLEIHLKKIVMIERANRMAQQPVNHPATPLVAETLRHDSPSPQPPAARDALPLPVDPGPRTVPTVRYFGDYELLEEIALGDIKNIGPHSDVYSLGAVLYALITGRPPFTSESTATTLLQVTTQEPVPPRQLDPSIDRDVETIALKAIEKYPDRRYTSATALREDIDRFLTGHPILARPVGRVERSRRWCLRNPSIAALSAVLLISLIAGSVISSLFAIQANRKAVAETLARKRADDNTVKANQAEKKAETEAERAKREAANARKAEAAEKEESRRAHRNLYVAHMKLAQAAWEDANVGETVRLLDLYRPAEGQEGGPDDLRGFEWYYWDRLCHSDLLTLVGHADRVRSVVFSPDGKRLASASEDKTMKVWDARPWTPELRVEQEALVRSYSTRTLSTEELLGRTLADATVSEPVRNRALEFAREWKQTE